MRSRNLVPNLLLLRKRWKLLNKEHFLMYIPRSLSVFSRWRLLPSHVKRAQTQSLGGETSPPADWSTEVCTFRGILPFSRFLGGPRGHRRSYSTSQVQGDLWPSLFLLLSFKKRGFPTPTEGPPGRMGGERRHVRGRSVSELLSSSESDFEQRRDRNVKIWALVRQWLRHSSGTFRAFLQLLGLLNSAADQVVSGRLYICHLQLLLLSAVVPLSDLLDPSVRAPGSRYGISGPRSDLGSRLPRQPRKFRCSRTPPSMGGAPMWTRGICPWRACGHRRSLVFPSIFWIWRLSFLAWMPSSPPYGGNVLPCSPTTRWLSHIFGDRGDTFGHFAPIDVGPQLSAHLRAGGLSWFRVTSHGRGTS
jgi:hypothetical protein